MTSICEKQFNICLYIISLFYESLDFRKLTCLQRKIKRKCTQIKQISGGKLSRLARMNFNLLMQSQGEIYPGWTSSNFIPANRDHIITILLFLLEKNIFTVFINLVNSSLLPGNVVVRYCFTSFYFIFLSVYVCINCKYVMFINKKRRRRRKQIR